MRVLLVDDHSLFISGLQSLLEAGGITVVGKARDGAAAVAMARKLRPDVVLMDIQMPGCDGLTATRLIKTEFPEIKIVMLTMNDEDQLLLEAAKSGASGFLLKNLEAEEFLALLEGVTRGEAVFSPGLAERLLQEFAHVKDENSAGAQAKEDQARMTLTQRQEEVLVHIARGLTYKDVAAVLNISETTVKYHMHEILKRLHLENRTQAIAYAVQNNLTEADERN
ncbi:MAG: response regulator transcription factor [Veillonellales bacterium]